MCMLKTRMEKLHYTGLLGMDKVTVELLIQNGSDAHAKDSYGKTPLHWAAWNGQSDCRATDTKRQ